MKTLKVLAIIAIVISSIGIVGSFILLSEQNSDGVLALMVYGYFLAFSIVAIKVTKKND